MLMIALFIPTVSKADMEITGTGTKYTQVSVSDAYDFCRNLNTTYSVLGTDQLDAHLVLNKDWGAVAYLAISAYGKVTTSTGPSVSGHTSTTGNMGKTWTVTSAGHITGLETAPNAVEFRQSLIENKDTKYVELLPASENVTNTKGMAISETGMWPISSSYYYCKAQTPILYRRDVLGFGGLYGTDTGGPSDSSTFRPAIWNK